MEREHDSEDESSQNAKSNTDFVDNFGHEEFPQVSSGEECEACHQKSSDLKTCSRCKKSRYCSRDCQRAHWKQHKKVCGKVPGSASRDQTSGSRQEGNFFSKILFSDHTVHDRPDYEHVPCLMCNELSEKLPFKCSKCKIAKYCCRKCQSNHLPKHRNVCEKYALQIASGEVVKNQNGFIPRSVKVRTPFLLCQICKKDNLASSMMKCPKCKTANVCIRHVERNERQGEHAAECENYALFFEMANNANLLLGQIHGNKSIKTNFPPTYYHGMMHQVCKGDALLAEIGDPCYQVYKKRLGIYVKDIDGKMFKMVFYHDEEEERSLLPETLTQLTAKGNFIRWFYPRWRFFNDGSHGFRVDSLDELEFIPKSLTSVFSEMNKLFSSK